MNCYICPNYGNFDDFGQIYIFMRVQNRIFYKILDGYVALFLSKME